MTLVLDKIHSRCTYLSLLYLYLHALYYNRMCITHTILCTTTMNTYLLLLLLQPKSWGQRLSGVVSHYDVGIGISCSRKQMHISFSNISCFVTPKKIWASWGVCNQEWVMMVRVQYMECLSEPQCRHAWTQP